MAEDGERIFEEPAGEYPPRLWWLKRVSAACAIMLVLLAALELWWWHAAQTRFDEAIARLRAAGDPASVEDLQSDDLKDADNAAYYLKFAASKINLKLDSPLNSNVAFDEGVFPYPPKWFAMEEAAAAANQSAFADL